MRPQQLLVQLQIQPMVQTVQVAQVQLMAVHLVQVVARVQQAVQHLVQQTIVQIAQVAQLQLVAARVQQLQQRLVQLQTQGLYVEHQYSNSFGHEVAIIKQPLNIASLSLNNKSISKIIDKA